MMPRDTRIDALRANGATYRSRATQTPRTGRQSRELVKFFHLEFLPAELRLQRLARHRWVGGVILVASGSTRGGRWEIAISLGQELFQVPVSDIELGLHHGGTPQSGMHPL